MKEAIDSLLKVYQLQHKFQETSISANWELIVGKPIAARTSEVYVKKNKLFLKLTSAPLKKELLITQKKLIEIINQFAQQDLISEIVFL